MKVTSRAKVPQSYSAVEEMVSIEITVTSRKFKCKLMRHKFLSSTALTFVKSMYQIGNLFRKITMKISKEKTRGIQVMAVGYLLKTRCHVATDYNAETFWIFFRYM